MLLAGAALGGLTVVLVVAELRTSWSQARVLATVSRAMTFEASGETGPGIVSPPGPYDQRLGYTRLPAFTSRLTERGCVLAGEAQVSPRFHEAKAWGLFPIFLEKTQAGLRVVGPEGRTLYQARTPEQTYTHFDAIPPLVVQTLLAIENQSLLNTDHRYYNPAVEWDRPVRAGISFGIHAFDPSYPMVGERVLLDSDAGMKTAEVAAKYRVSGSWVRLLKQRRRDTGAVAPRVQRQGRRGLLAPHLHTVADLIAAHPDRTLAELKDALATPASVPTVWRAVRALGLTVKKNGPPVRTRSA